jgi:arylsulfatase A-like enzyme
MKRPNIIVFFTDQQRWDTCGIHGNPLNLTPNFDRLATAGTHARHAFTCQPVCGPARSCMQTGRYATSTGCFRNGIGLPPGAATLARHFRSGGYSTGYIGKWHLAGDGSAGPVEPENRGGYEHWLAANALEVVSDAYDCRVYDANKEEVRLPGYRVDALTDAAIRHVSASASSGQPFFLFLSFLEPHHQNHRDDYPAPDGYAERYAGRWMPTDLAALGGSAVQHIGGYFGMVKRLDEAFGRLVDTLRSLQLLDDTIVVFTSDHGCHFKTRNTEYKRSIHESSIRVPLLFHGPGFMGGGDVGQLVSLIDLPPTLLDAAGLPVPAEMQGRSLMGLLRGNVTDWPEEVFVQTSEFALGRGIRTSRWKYGVTAPGVDAWENAAASCYEEQYLYDLKADPYELTNLAGYESHRGVADRLKQRLLARMAEAGEAIPEIRPAASTTDGQRRVLPEEINQ